LAKGLQAAPNNALPARVVVVSMPCCFGQILSARSSAPLRSRLLRSKKPFLRMWPA
jgi:hypothetical protein